MVYMMAACAATMASADGWRLSVGPAWRTRVKAEIRGTASVPSVPGSYTRTGYDRDPGAGDWTPGEVTERRPDPSPAAAPGDELWAVGASFTETTVTPDGGAAGVDATDTRAPLGLKARAGHDVWTAGDFSLALDLRLAERQVAAEGGVVRRRHVAPRAAQVVPHRRERGERAAVARLAAHVRVRAVGPAVARAADLVAAGASLRRRRALEPGERAQAREEAEERQGDESGPKCLHHITPPGPGDGRRCPAPRGSRAP